MLRRLLSSLRTSLLLLILLAFLPALGLVLYTTLGARHSAAEAAKHEAVLLAQQLSARHAEQVESARQLLAALDEVRASLVAGGYSTATIGDALRHQQRSHRRLLFQWVEEQFKAGISSTEVERLLPA